jgi:hypothetical protein
MRSWLALREPADAAARASELVEPIRRRLNGGPVVIHDLGAGTGSLTRWLAPRLPGPQRWILHDRDAGLLDHAATTRVLAADGAPVAVATRRRDITRLTSGELVGADLVTTSALLDLLTADEIQRIAEACAGYPALMTLSVTGEVQLTPPDPLDAAISDAFNAHQRRTVAGRRLLGPDAIGVTTAAFGRWGATVRARPSPWRLGADQADLIDVWLKGWVGAACEQQPQLAGPARAYTARRQAEVARGRLDVVVHHHDLLAEPPAAGGT